MDKAIIRKNFIAKRRAMSRPEVVAKSTVIAQRVQGLVNWQVVQRIHMYRAQRLLREVDTSWFEAYLATVWPHIELTISNADKKATIPAGDFDVILVPIVSFDNHLHRVGFGGGWYDRFLANQPTATKIGLAYDLQRAAHIIRESHDVPLDMIVTESTMFTK